MQGKTHLVAGALAGLLVVRIGSIPFDGGAQLEVPLGVGVLYAGLAGLAALVPDWLQVNIPGVKQIKGVFGHRGFSHWVWTALGVGWLLWPTGLGLPVAVGWLSHIGLDALSSGVPAFWPFGRLTVGRIHTGGRLDTFIGAAALVLAVAVSVSLGR